MTDDQKLRDALEYFQRWLDVVDAPDPEPPFVKSIFNSLEEIEHVRNLVTAARKNLTWKVEIETETDISKSVIKDDLYK